MVVGELTSLTFREVPEPGTFALFGVGLLALGFLVRRRRAAPASGQPEASA